MLICPGAGAITKIYMKSDFFSLWKIIIPITYGPYETGVDERKFNIRFSGYRLHGFIVVIFVLYILNIRINIKLI